MNVKIVGPGCKNCTTLYEITKHVVESFDEDITVEHISEVSEMMALGVSKSPGVMINDKIVSQGKRLKEKEVVELIKQYL